MTEGMLSILLSRLIDLANIGLALYALKRGFDYLTAGLERHGAEPLILERKDKTP